MSAACNYYGTLVHRVLTFVSAVVQMRCWPLRTVRVSITWSTRHTGLSPSQLESSSIRSMSTFIFQNSFWSDSSSVIRLIYVRDWFEKKQKDKNWELKRNLRLTGILCVAFAPLFLKFTPSSSWNFRLYFKSLFLEILNLIYGRNIQTPC